MIKKISIGLVSLVLVLFSCKKHFTEENLDLVGAEHFQFKKYRVQHITAYSRKVPRVFGTRNPLLGFGVYKHPVYGLTEGDLTIRFANTSAFDTDHFKNADSILFVDLRIPFFAKKDEDNSTPGFPQYIVDSIFGSADIDVKAYVSDYYFFPYDPSSNLVHPNMAAYYSDFDFTPYQGDLLAHDPTFQPDYGFIVDTVSINNDNLSDFETDKDQQNATKDTLPPHFVIHLDTTYFRHKFFDHAGEPVLTDPALFAGYFRGIILKAQNLSNNGTFMLMKPTVELVIAYRYHFTNDNDTPDDPSDDFLDHKYEKIILRGMGVVNTYKNYFWPSVDQKLQSPDTQNGEAKLYVKGDAGAQTIIKLFSPEELYNLRHNNWLINQANLRFYVDESDMNLIPESQQPAALYLYKYDSKTDLSDLNPILPDNSNVDLPRLFAVYDGTLREDTLNHLHFYQFNITRHIKDVLRRDSANVRLALRIVPKLSDYVTTKTQNKNSDPDSYLPFGTVLQGNLSTDKPVELNIYYTEPDTIN